MYITPSLVILPDIEFFMLCRDYVFLSSKKQKMLISRLLMLFLDRSLHSEKDNTMSSVQKNDVLRKDMLRFARSAPCSPKSKY